MSKTLNLVDILLTTGKHLFTMGRSHEALQPLTKLAGFRKLPDHVNEQLQALLAEIYLEKGEYKKARRHLTAAIAANPLEANYQFLMAIALVEDEGADFARAEAHFARAVEFDPDEAAYWLDYGSYLFKICKNKDGLRAIRKAYALDVKNIAIVSQVAEVLRREGFYEEATTKLRAALFENSGDQRFRQLWQQHQFEMIFIEQDHAARGLDKTPGKPVILPFKLEPRLERFQSIGGKTIRIDQAQERREPTNKRPLPFRRPPKKG
jgi:tetratricopeptide (TPR) repeat protein